MIILVADSSVLIDLERGHLLEAVLGGPDTIAVPDFLYDTELRDYNGPAADRSRPTDHSPGRRRNDLRPGAVQRTP